MQEPFPPLKKPPPSEGSFWTLILDLTQLLSLWISACGAVRKKGRGRLGRPRPRFGEGERAVTRRLELHARDLHLALDRDGSSRSHVEHVGKKERSGDSEEGTVDLR